MRKARQALALLALLLALLAVRPSSAAPAAALLPPSDLYLAEAGGGRWASLDGTLWLTPEALWMALPGPAGRDEWLWLRLTFEGAQPGAQLRPADAQRATLSRYGGRSAARWQERRPLWGSVRYEGLYPGGALSVRGERGQLALHWLPDGPATAAAPLRLSVAGAALTAEGLLRTPWGPRALPLLAARGALPAAAFRAPRAASTLAYSTLLGSALWDEATAVTSDGQGRFYVAGHTLALEFPARPGPTRAPQHAVESFAARLSPAGGLEWLVLVTSDVEEWATGLALGPQGALTVVGHTDSTDFPTTAGAFDPTPNGGFDAFAMQLDGDGSLRWATLLGGAGTETVGGVALDEAGRPCVAGGTWSADFPTTAGALQAAHAGERDSFVSCLTPTGAALAYSTFLGGSGQDQATALVADGAGRLALTGWTRSADLPTTPGAWDRTLDGPFDAFLLRLRPGAATLDFGSYVGGAGEDRGAAIARVGEGLAIAGSTRSADFPTTPGAWDRTYGAGSCDFAPCADGFVVRLSADGSRLALATLLGGSGGDEVRGLSADPSGALYAVGTTDSADFPVSGDAVQGQRAGPSDAFAAALSADGAALSHATLLGGSGGEAANAVALSGGRLLVAGRSDSADFPTTPDAFRPNASGDHDAFLAALGGLAPHTLFLPLTLR